MPHLRPPISMVLANSSAAKRGGLAVPAALAPAQLDTVRRAAPRSVTVRRARVRRPGSERFRTILTYRPRSVATDLIVAALLRR
jgi:hypothetical protein